MKKSDCIEDKCRFYDYHSECSYDGCMYGASAEDKEEERGCYGIRLCKNKDFQQRKQDI